MIDADVTAVAIGHVIEVGGSGPAIGSVVLGSANEPARDADILSDIFEFRDGEAVIQILPCDALIRATE